MVKTTRLAFKALAMLLMVVSGGMILSACGVTASRPANAAAGHSSSPHRRAPPSRPRHPSWQSELAASSAEPVHLTCQGLYTYPGVPFGTTIHLVEAFDPLNHEVQQQDEITVAAGSSSSTTVTSDLIGIGSHVWVKLTPPGGSWREEVIGSPSNPASFYPDLTDIHPVPGIVVEGRSTTGWAATLNIAALTRLLPSATTSAESAAGITTDYTFYLGPAGHIREVVVTVASDQGLSQKLTCVYQQYGLGLNLTAP